MTLKQSLVAIALVAPIAAQAAPGVDIKAQKSCNLYPANGPTAIVCRIDVLNIGTVASIAPISIVDQVISAPPGTTYTGSPFSSFPCSTPTGTVPPLINCSGNVSLVPGSSGSTFVYFKLPASGGTFKNCATATSAQNPGTPGDVDPLNNKSCFQITVPPTGPDLAVNKVCVVNGLHSVLCTVKVSNVGNGPSVSPIIIQDTVVIKPANALYTGAGGNLPISCTPGAGAITPISCTANAVVVPGTPKEALFSFTLPTGGQFKNCATVTMGVTDPTPANNTNICSPVIMVP